MFNGATPQTALDSLSRYLRPAWNWRVLLPAPARRVLRETGTETVATLKAARNLARRHWKILVLSLLSLAIVAAVLTQVDAAGLEMLTFPKKSAATPLARGFSKWGDFQTGFLLLAALVWGVGAAGRSFSWRQAALAMVLGATVAGLCANVLRFSVGRPRPSAGLADGLYGPSLKHKFHGFPSAHAATSFGAAGAITMVCPPAGLVALPTAAAISWSRLQLRRHHPSDIWVGGGIGLISGSFVGLAALRRRRARRAAMLGNELVSPEVTLPAPLLAKSALE
jgi:membrane-associated phospholipid phosphatase